MSEIIKGMELMNLSITYAEAIVQGWKTFKQVPKYFKSDTAVALIAIYNAEELITDPAYVVEAKERIAAAEEQEE